MKSIFFGIIATLFSVTVFAQNNYKTKNLQNKLKLAYTDNLMSQSTSLLYVSAKSQRLYLIDMETWTVKAQYIISTATKGLGNEAGSDKTPLGMHSIAKKIGAGQPSGMIFKSRAATGKIATITTKAIDTEDDFVTTRIMWLTGEEDSNTGDNTSSYDRYVYIHGTPEEGLLGTPASHGCIRMKNADVIQLFNSISEGTLVFIDSGNILL